MSGYSELWVVPSQIIQYFWILDGDTLSDFIQFLLFVDNLKLTPKISALNSLWLQSYWDLEI